MSRKSFLFVLQYYKLNFLFRKPSLLPLSDFRPIFCVLTFNASLNVFLYEGDKSTLLARLHRSSRHGLCEELNNEVKE